jgi:PAS domain S-box-containing protein
LKTGASRAVADAFPVGVSAGSFVVAVAIAFLLGPQQPIPCVLAFLSAVCCAAWYTGFRFTVCILAVCVPAIRYLLLPPIHSFGLKSPANTAAICAFLVTGSLLAVMTGRFRSLRRLSSVHQSQLEQVARKDDAQLLTVRLQLQTEIAERQRVQEAMAYFQAEYQRLFQQANDAILIFAPNSEIILEVNRKACELYGVARAKLLGSSVRLLFERPEDLETHIARITSVETFETFETVHRRHDGSPIHVTASAARVVYRGIPAILSINHDVTERKRYAEQEARFIAEQVARAEAQAAQARIANILERIADAFFALDESWRFTYVNREAERLLAHSKDSLLGEMIWEKFPEVIGSRTYQQLQIAMSEQICTAFETFDSRLKLWLELRVYPSVNGLAVYFRDITERHQSEEALRRNGEALRLSQQRLRLAHRMAKFSSWELDLDSGEMHWSEGSGTGYGEPDGHFHLSYTEWLQRISSEDRERVEQSIREVINTGSDVDWAFRIRWPDDSTHWLTGRGHVLRDSNGKALRLIGATMDVTRSKQAEDAALHLASIVESSDDAIISMDLQGNINTWNAGAEKTCGYDAAEVLGWPISIVSAPGCADTVLHSVRAIGQGERTNHLETAWRRKDGNVIDVLMTLSPIHDAAHNVIGLSAIGRDVTDHKKMERVLRLNEKLAETGRLAASIAHEINNPMATLTDIIFLLEHSLSADQPAHQYVAIARQEAARISHITTHMLSLYRESKEPVPVDLSEVVESAISLYASKMKMNGIRSELRNDHRCEVLAFPAEMRQVFSNFVANAVEACGTGSTIRVHVRNSRSWSRPETRGVRVVIADNGSGISEQSRQQLFRPFFTTKGEKGTGLGLWVTQSIVRKHGGFIRVRSSTAPDRSGTCFSVFIPVLGQDTRLLTASPELAL